MRVVAGLAFCGIVVLSAGWARAAPCSTFPYTLTNGTTADASQVMTDFTAVGNCAAPLSSPSFTGNVGIGTSVPQSGLQLGDSTASPLNILTLGKHDASSESFLPAIEQKSILSAGFGNDLVLAAQSTSGGIVFYTGATSTQNSLGSGSNTIRMAILATGNVGIGSAAPDALLSTMNGNIHIGNSSTANQSGLIFDRGAAVSNTSLQASITDVWNGGLPGNNEALVFNVGAPGAADDYRFKTAGTDRLVISGVSGDVGIATTNPAYPLDVVGDIRTSTCLRFSGGGQSGTCTSDIALKRDVEPFALGLQAVVALKPVNFHYNGLGGNPDDGVKQLGLIAQDVEPVAAELVGTRYLKLRPSDAKATAVKTVNYAALTYMLINAVKELKAANDNDAAQIKILRAQVSDLRKRAGMQIASLGPK